MESRHLYDDASKLGLYQQLAYSWLFRQCRELWDVTAPGTGRVPSFTPSCPAWTGYLSILGPALKEEDIG